MTKKYTPCLYTKPSTYSDRSICYMLGPNSFKKCFASSCVPITNEEMLNEYRNNTISMFKYE